MIHGLTPSAKLRRSPRRILELASVFAPRRPEQNSGTFSHLASFSMIHHSMIAGERRDQGSGSKVVEVVPLQHSGRLSDKWHFLNLEAKDVSVAKERRLATNYSILDFALGHGHELVKHAWIVAQARVLEFVCDPHPAATSYHACCLFGEGALNVDVVIRDERRAGHAAVVQGFAAVDVAPVRLVRQNVGSGGERAEPRVIFAHPRVDHLAGELHGRSVEIKPRCVVPRVAEGRLREAIWE
eukprot:74405-Pleurochrysis_carterae.AAC.2